MTVPNPARYRNECGTYRGLRLHQDAAEEACSECLRQERARQALYGSEAGRRLLAEAIPQRPSAPAEMQPVTPEQAELHRQLLESELIAYEKAHAGSRPHLRAI